MLFHEQVAVLHKSLTPEQHLYVQSLMARHQATVFYNNMVDLEHRGLETPDAREDFAITQALVLFQVIPEDEFEKLSEVIGEKWDEAIETVKGFFGG